MKISIITTSWNSEETIRDTILSVLAQTYQDYEHIIVDGASSDRTMQIVKQFESQYGGRLRYVSEPDKGIYDAMNKGLRMASGDVVGFLNSNDFYADNHVLKLIADTFGKNNAVYGDLVFVDDKNTQKVVRVWKGSQHKYGGFLKGWHPAHPTFYASKWCFDQFGPFDITYDVSADFELMLRFIEKNHIPNQYIPHTLVKMRMGGESTGSIAKIITGNKNILKAFKKNGYKVSHFYLVQRLAPKALNFIRNKLPI